ncbi:MAG TPA: response regulator [Terriglobales bacterium]|nr:response regulator [Terriglobales bacterium]
MPQRAIEILLVEDNPADIELTLAALRRNHLVNEIHICRDGEEALEYLFGNGGEQAASLKVVLLDLKLPKVDGLQVLREIKNNPATRVLPVVVLTSSREERDMVESYNLGSNSYIQKPVDFEQFREMVRQIGLYWLVVNQPVSPAAALVAANGVQR